MHWAGYKKAWESAQLWIQRSDFWAAEDARFCMSGNKGGGRCAKGGPENMCGTALWAFGSVKWKIWKEQVWNICY